MLKKCPSADLRISYPLFVEAGIIVALLICILCVKVEIPTNDTPNIEYVKADETALVLPPSVSEVNTIKPPPKPEVPVYIPNDEPIEPEEIQIPEYDQYTRLEIPPLPQQIFVEPTHELFKDIEKLPEIIGGDQAFEKSIKYPERARLAGIQGIVEVEFTVSETGEVLDAVILKGLGHGCDQAVLKAIQLQRYKPGKKAGKPSSFRIKETVQFILLNT